MASVRTELVFQAPYDVWWRLDAVPNFPGISPPGLHLEVMALLYRIAADVVLALHAAYVLFVIAGFLLTAAGCLAGWRWIRNRWFRGVHLALIGIVVAEAWCGIVCPLTTLEQTLRDRAGQQSYQGAFVANLVHDWLFYDAPPWVFTLAYTLFGAAVAAMLYVAPPRWKLRTTGIAGNAAAGSTTP